MRFNGWQRLGVVVSIVWAIGGAIYQRTADVNRAADTAALFTGVCQHAHPANPDRCSGKYEQTFRLWLEGSWGNVAAMALGPVLLGWVIVYLVIRVVRWVGAGFRR